MGFAKDPVKRKEQLDRLINAGGSNHEMWGYMQCTVSIMGVTDAEDTQQNTDQQANAQLLGNQQQQQQQQQPAGSTTQQI
jgi:hypothetical protein